jgi:penicillin-binding protein 2
MLVVDELKKNDPQLRLIALGLAGGLFILFAGLWWVQVVKSREYQSHREAQAYRTVRLPAVRGKILDCEGRVLAENRPRYNLCLYFDDLNEQFKAEYNRIRPIKIAVEGPPFWKFWSHTKTAVTNRVKLKPEQVDVLTWQARCNVAVRAVTELGRQLGEPLALDPKKFMRAYEQERAMPFTVLPDLSDAQIARFQEKYSGGLGAELVMQPIRSYPNDTTAAHLLGVLRKEKEGQSLEGEFSFYDYRLPDYVGATGIEGKFDSELHGRAGLESVLVNNLGYRISEDVETQPQPGADVLLTVDLDLQRAAEDALEAAVKKYAGNVINGAVVVMDVRNGDVLAMVSSPAFDPNAFAQGISHEEYQEIQEHEAEKNRATFENYAPGSIFKPVVALAALDNGLNPNETYRVQADPARSGRGCIYVGKRKIEDTAPPGDYDFKHALIHSSNSYFIYFGLQTAHIENIVALGKKFHFGERTELFANQETKGSFPSPTRVQKRAGWVDGETANVCIGQGAIDVTPIQIAVAYSAIANGGTVFWPRIVSQVKPQELSGTDYATNFPAGRVRDHLNVQPRSMNILHEAMFADVQSSEGTGRKAAVPGLNICAKTGTAQVQDSANRLIGHNYWFASFAPAESPRYAVVAMVQSPTLGGSGGDNCAPIAHDIYAAILKKESSPKTVARN